MVAFSKIAGFVERLCEKEFNFASDQFVVALSNTAPGSESTPPTGSTAAAILANVTQISYANLSSRNLTTVSSSQTGGTYTCVFADLILTASGAVGPYRYVYVYDDTATNDPLVGYYDRGASISLATGETDTVDFTSSFISLA